MSPRRREHVQGLRLGHQALVDAIDHLQPVLRSYREAKPRLKALEHVLLSFFAWEDESFFQALLQFFEGDRYSLQMIDFLMTDLRHLKVQFLVFFERHSGDAADQSASTFPKDFMDFSALVIARVKMEEERLCPLLEKIEGESLQ